MKKLLLFVALALGVNAQSQSIVEGEQSRKNTELKTKNIEAENIKKDLKNAGINSEVAVFQESSIIVFVNSDSEGYKLALVDKAYTVDYIFDQIDSKRVQKLQKLGFDKIRFKIYDEDADSLDKLGIKEI